MPKLLRSDNQNTQLECGSACVLAQLAHRPEQVCDRPFRTPSVDNRRLRSHTRPTTELLTSLTALPSGKPRCNPLHDGTFLHSRMSTIPACLSPSEVVQRSAMIFQNVTSEIGSRYPRIRCNLELGVTQHPIARHWKSKRNDSADENTNGLLAG